MSDLAAILLFCVIMLIFPAGRRVFLLFLGVIYIPAQMFFMWLQKINLGLKDKDPLAYYLSCLIVYPIYAVLIVFSKIYESLQSSLS